MKVVTTRIQQITVANRRVDPAQAEIVISIQVENLTQATRAAGRLVGPKCRYAATVEVAYPMQVSSGLTPDSNSAHLWLRVVIPEPCLWDPESPFVYDGCVELYDEGKLCDRREFLHGLAQPRLTATGAICNARSFTLRAASAHAATEPAMNDLRQQGINALFVDSPPSATMQVFAARFGFFLIRQTPTAGSDMAQARASMSPSKQELLGPFFPLM